MRLWFPPIPSLPALTKEKYKFVSPLTSRVCRRFGYLENTSLCVYWHLRLITSFCPFVSTGLMSIRGTDSRAVCQARQSLAYSVETDCHLGLDSVVRFAKWWHGHPLKCLWNVCLWSVSSDPSPLYPLTLVSSLTLLQSQEWASWPWSCAGRISYLLWMFKRPLLASISLPDE